MRRFVGLAAVLGVLGIAVGSQVAGAASTDPAVALCNKYKGAYATFSDPITFQAGYTCTRTGRPFSLKQLTNQANVCLADEGGLDAFNKAGGTIFECINKL
jgi:hypothetical protein